MTFYMITFIIDITSKIWLEYVNSAKLKLPQILGIGRSNN